MLKKIIAICLFNFMLFNLAACGKSNNEPMATDNTQSMQSVKEEKTIRLEEIQSTGQIPYDKFDIGGLRIQNSKADLFPFSHNEKMGYADINGNVVISERYYEVTPFFEEKAFVRDTEYVNDWYIINKKSEKLLQIPKKYHYSNSVKFENNKAILDSYLSNVETGNIDILVISSDMTTREFSVPVGFDSCVRSINTSEFSGVLIGSTKWYSTQNNIVTYSLYDEFGKEIWKTNITINGVIASSSISLSDFTINNGYMNVVDENKKWGLLNVKTGELSIPYKYDKLGTFSDGVVPICSYDKWGYIDASGNEVVKPQFEYTGTMMNGVANAINSENKFCLIDKTGKIIKIYDIIYDGNENKEYPYMKETGIGMVLTGDGDGGEFADNITLFSSNGEILLNISHCNDLFISTDYIFADGKMYKISI